MTHSVRKDLSTNCKDTEALCIEVVNAKSREILVKTKYRQLVGRHYEF